MTKPEDVAQVVASLPSMHEAPDSSTIWTRGADVFVWPQYKGVEAGQSDGQGHLIVGYMVSWKAAISGDSTPQALLFWKSTDQWNQIQQNKEDTGFTLPW